MPSGGARPGAGRPFGSKDSVARVGSHRREVARLHSQVNEFFKTNSAAVFDGNSLELCITLYKNEDLPLNLRLHAAALALPFECPRLVATASVTKHVDGDDAQFGKLFTRIEQRLALAPPERRAEVIELLRSESEDL